MSDLGGAGRASNGGNRSGGPVPVSSGAAIRTPRDVMRDRNAREARRQEQQREEEQRRVAEERRKSAERRAATVPGAVPRFSGASSVYSAEVLQGNLDPAAERRSSRVAGEVAGTNVLGEPTGRGSSEPPIARARPSGAQPEPLRVQQQQQQQQQPPAASAHRRTQSSQAGPRQPTTATAATAGGTSGHSAAGSAAAATVAGEDSQRGNQSSFPHAFERWETLSSHWEGLTSYWLHKLEQNTEEIRQTVPNATTLNRQITDLSAAGANLFHAVVELQRLRASSERKFQRWFFETRADNEKSRELQAGMERQLNRERESREETARQQADAAIAVESAKRQVAEMRRELMISKDEARRAWEELGRRNQESLDTAQSLKEGRVTLVSGVQVVPYSGGYSRTGSVSHGQRPATSHGQDYSNAAFSAGAAGLATPGDDEHQYYREERPSPTDTDPFTESGRQQPPLHHEPGQSALAQGTYHPQGAASSSQAGAGPTVAPGAYGQSSPSQQRAAQPSSVTSPETQRFYQHAGPTASLHSSQASSQSQRAPAMTAATMPAASRTDARSQPRSEASYVDTISEGGTEYALDAQGSILRDEQGRPLPFRRRETRRSSGSEDDFDTEEEVRREHELARYGGGMVPEAPSVPSTSAQAMAGFTPTTTAGAGEIDEGPDYEGQGYDNYQQAVPSYMQRGQHHHPTRLSDVLEEDEERSSRRTGPD